MTGNKLVLVHSAPEAQEPPRRQAGTHDPWAEEKRRTMGMLEQASTIASERLVDVLEPANFHRLTPFEQLAAIKLAFDVSGTARRMRNADPVAPTGDTTKTRELGNHLRSLAGKLQLPELVKTDDRA